MKYPAILKNTIGGQTVLAVSGKLFIHMSGEFEVEDSESYSFDSRYKNITAEYLANTYGKVKSKEHAEFIKLLAENAGIDVFPQLLDVNHFVIKGKLSFHNCERITSSELKQITIPLPPECESVDEWPCVNDEVLTSDGNGVVKLLPDSKGYYIVSVGGEYYQYQLYELEKPKTPEQELREFLHLLWRENNEDFDDFADIAILHLKKKGEGDESC